MAPSGYGMLQRWQDQVHRGGMGGGECGLGLSAAEFARTDERIGESSVSGLRVGRGDVGDEGEVDRWRGEGRKGANVGV